MVAKTIMQQKKIFFFLIKFFGIFIALYYALISLDSIFLQHWIAAWVANALSLPVQGNQIIVGDNVFQVTESCTGLVSAILLTAVVFSVKQPKPKQKIQIWVLGLLVLFFANLIRLISVLWIGLQFGVNSANAAHEISWIAMSAIILALWYFGVQKVAGKQAFEELL